MLVNYFLLFMIYSFIGWFIEILNYLIRNKTFVNRGFLIGPYLPIYGFGSLAIIVFLKKYSHDVITLFCMCAIVCCTLEFFTSLIMEKLFRARWWDYSNKKLNIDGRICLETAAMFGIGGCIIIYLAQPIIQNILNVLPPLFLNIIAIILFMILVIDVLVSFKIIFNFRTFAANVKKDSTKEINKMVRKMISSKSLLGSRLMKAFPNLQLNIKSLQSKSFVLSRKRK